MEPSSVIGTPPSASKGRGRRAGAGRGGGLGRGSGATKDVSSAKPGASAATALGATVGVSTSAGAPGTGNTAAAAGPAATAAAGSLGAAGGVVKKRGRVPKAKPAGDLPAAGGVESGPEDMPDATLPYRGTFTKDLSRLMYGFGDYENPVQETINVVEDILVEYVRETCCSAINEAVRVGKLDRDRSSSAAAKLKVDEKDILFLVRKDPKKYTRIRELLDMQLLIKEARKNLHVEISEGEAEGGGPAGGASGASGAGLEDDPGEELPDLPDEDILDAD